MTLIGSLLSYGLRKTQYAHLESKFFPIVKYSDEMFVPLVLHQQIMQYSAELFTRIAINTQHYTHILPKNESARH